MPASPRWRCREIPWSRSKALAAIRALLSQTDGEDRNVQALRRQLNHMFLLAQESGKAEPIAMVSSG